MIGFRLDFDLFLIQGPVADLYSARVREKITLTMYKAIFSECTGRSASCPTRKRHKVL